MELIYYICITIKTKGYEKEIFFINIDFNISGSELKTLLESYYTCTWKGYDIEKLLSIPHGRITITNKIKELTKNGETILNTNIPKELYGV